MADQPLREIQISAKQLVFIFMASVVIAVAVFLLGVSVGRGVKEGTGGTSGLDQAAVPSAPVGPTSDPGPTQIEPDSLKYPELSKVDSAANARAAGKTADATPQAQPVADAPEISEPAAQVAASAAPPAPVPAPAPAASAAAKAAPKVEPAAKADAPKAAAGWSVQVNAFRSRDNAEKQVASLKDKGYPAFLMPGQPGGLYRVRVGPYPQRADADRMTAKLRQEGFNPSVTR